MIIGIVGSAIVFPVGIVILIYYLCSGRPDKEKGTYMSLHYSCMFPYIIHVCLSSHFFSSEKYYSSLYTRKKTISKTEQIVEMTLPNSTETRVVR